MRGVVPGLENPHPLGLALPALYHEDEFTQRWLAGLDEVLAPVLSTLDNIDAYFDPWLAPEDFVSWLGTWVGVAIDENWSPARRRALVAGAAELYRARGTAAGLAAEVAMYTGSTPEIVESGGAVWSGQPEGALPGDPSCTVTVRIAGSAADLERLDRIVARAKPAHVTHTIEIAG